jgi:Na+/proline symporter
MMLFSSNKLERSLAAGSLSSWEKAKCIIFIVILYSFLGTLYVFTPSCGQKPPLWYSLMSLVSISLVLCLTYFGARQCYLTNRAIDDTDFSGRFAALFVPLTFKFLAVMLPIMVIAAVIAYSGSPDKETKNDLFVYFLYCMAPGGTYLFYVFLNQSFKRLGTLVNDEEKTSSRGRPPDRL